MSACADLTKQNDDNLQMLYWTIRAYCCETPFPCKSSIEKFLADQEKEYLALLNSIQTIKTEIEQKDDYWKYFLLFFYRYQGILFNHSGQKQFRYLIEMIWFLGKYLDILKVNEQIQTQREGTIMSYVVIIVIFSLYNTIEGYSDEQKYDAKRLKKTIPQMETSDFMKECLKFSFGILSNFMDLIIQIDDENYLNLIFPVVYYLMEYKNQCAYFFANFKQFQKIMNKLYYRLRDRYTKLKVEQADFAATLKTCLLPNEASLLGFIPLKAFFSQFKSQFTPFAGPKEQVYALKLFQIITLLPELKGFALCDESDVFKLEQKDGEEEKKFNILSDFNILGDSSGQQFIWDQKEEKKEELFEDEDDLKQDIRKEIEDSFKNLPTQHELNVQKTLIVVDGMNVAIRHGRDKRFSSKGLKIAIDYWLKK